MSRVRIKTDNSNLEVKVRLRSDYLPEKKKIRVLDCFAGHQLIWNEIKRRNPKHQFEVTPIYQKKMKTKRLYLQGDNRKFLPSFKLDEYDVIDLDAYGISFDILDYCLTHSKTPVIFLTYIQTVFGGLPTKFLEKLGYTRKMIEKIPTLFYKNAIKKLLQYFAISPCVASICWYNIEHKYYIVIRRKTAKLKG